ncbi:YczI family protein [Pseudalkalibacillus hwajinpoensis]|uniref:YczI family protein n=1 Tax=Guptibacillus hwajinpoensis TaxID=208199 RepID=UPI001F0DAFB0|nr:YczI family protein [Pseudalkalibacillus hwajinpoensis]
MKVLRLVLSIITFSISVYVLITKHIDLMPLMMFFLSILMLVMGIEEFQKERKTMGLLLVGAFLFALFVSMEGALLN